MFLYVVEIERGMTNVNKYEVTEKQYKRLRKGVIRTLAYLLYCYCVDEIGEGKTTNKVGSFSIEVCAIQPNKEDAKKSLEKVKNFLPLIQGLNIQPMDLINYYHKNFTSIGPDSTNFIVKTFNQLTK